MNSHEKMLGILDLFDSGEDALAVTFDEMHERLGYTRSTLYRYLKTLTDAGLLTSLPSVGYMLGPRIVELDYKIRTGDVLIRAARPVMEELASQFRGIALLCRRYRFDVLCVHQESGTDTIHSNYERGRRRSLLHGAASLGILAYLPDHQLRKFYGLVPEQFATAGLGTTLKEVKAALREHRQRGWVSTTGDVTPGVTGVAAPVFDSRSEILGSLSLTLRDSRTNPKVIEDVAERVVFCAGIISKTVARS
ncbi:DNA-binding IclR family transcriptional regulator [Sinorhizobium terangae]|uniref:Helix-turn-helix domain-containing protein n=1 Tax=Sinorhizobium terangae TaxID=110322 RepID=A0A6N7L8K6_SINTE|nr:IclR family transcriptional regulator [Sinorhizobium terangae]MBB4187712.1 DNA-binding IclR family transcriptional regulator [Sinorhizobium terangae]MQX14173.1 helix-turn-helix domain-containing protein [Sinorhizobium terangae]